MPARHHLASRRQSTPCRAPHGPDSRRGLTPRVPRRPAAPHEASGGIVGVNRKGQVLCVTVDEANLVPYICKQLSDFPLALRLAVRNNLPGAKQLFTQQFNNLMNQSDFKGAAKLAAESPQQVLRTPETIARFQAAPAAPGQPTPILTYFGMLLEKGKLNAMESLELAKPVIQQGKQQLLQKWIGEEKLECTEELGDQIKMVDANLALSVYLRASASPKVIQCFMETNQFDKIMVYCQKVSYTPDWGFLLTHMVRSNPAAALDFAQKLAAAPDVSLDFGVVTDVFMQHNCLQQVGHAFCVDAFRVDPSHGLPRPSRPCGHALSAPGPPVASPRGPGAVDIPPGRGPGRVVYGRVRLASLLASLLDVL